MARALENPGTAPTYLEFFGFNRPPFARLTRPSQIFHTEQYSLLMSHLATATEKPDCLVVVSGADGSGKTTLLNRYITSLGEDVCFATIDETCNGEKDFFCAFLKQLGFTEITGTSSELWRITKEFLVHRGMADDPVLLIIDNAHLINPSVLEQLKKMSEIKVGNHHVLSIVLTGNADIDGIMKSPAMSQIKFNSQVHFSIRVYTEEETANYVWHRLRLAGGSDVVKFSNEAHQLIYRYTGGIPKLINMVCNELLTEAFAAETHEITEELVRNVADTRKLVPHVVPLQGKGRRKTDPDFRLVQPDEESGERIAPRGSETKGTVKKPKTKTKVEKTSAGDENLLEQISELSAQVGEFRADKMQAVEDLAARDKEISELQARLDVQAADTGKLDTAIKDQTLEIVDLKKTLTSSTKALQDSEKAAKKLTKELEKEQAASKAARDAESEKVAALVDEHSQESARLKQALADSTKALLKSEKVAKKVTTDLEKEKAASKAARDAESEKVAALIDEHSEEVGRLKQALADSTKALLKSEKSSTKISKDLEKERKAVNAAEADVAKEKAKVEELNQMKADLQTSLDELKADLKDANKRAAESGKADEGTEELRDAVEEKEAELTALQAELESKDESYVELEELLEESKQECVSLRLKVAVLKNLEESVAKKDAEITELKEKLDSAGAKQKKSKAKGKKSSSSDVEKEQAERITILESELQEARDMLQRTQAQLSESGEQIILESSSVHHAPDKSQLEKMLEDAMAESESEEEPEPIPEPEVHVEEGSAELRAVPDPDPERDLESEETREVEVVSTSGFAALEVFEGGKSCQVLPIPEGDTRIMVGRSEDSELCLKSEFVSRHHALIISGDDGLFIEDLNSFNGTLVNSEKISRRKLEAGDKIMIGKYEIEATSAQ